MDVPLLINGAIDEYQMVNPGFRIVTMLSEIPFTLLGTYHVKKTSSLSADYDQHSMDIGNANYNEEATWQLEYRFTNAYNVSDITADSLEKILYSMATNNDTFSMYLSFNKALGIEAEFCNQARSQISTFTNQVDM